MVLEGPRSWEWVENKYSCDCNRNFWGVDTGKPRDICKGYERFLVIAAEMNDLEDQIYTLRELNAKYPLELLNKYGITNDLPTLWKKNSTGD